MRKSLLVSAIMLMCTLAAMAIQPSEQGARTMSNFKFKKEKSKTMVPQLSIRSFQDITSQAEKDRLARKGIQVSHNAYRDHSKNECSSQTKTLRRTDEKEYILTAKLKYNPEEIDRIEGVAYSNSVADYFYYNEWTEDPCPEQLEFLVPIGNYDVEILITTMVGDFIFLTSSEVNVNGDTEISLDTADATVEIVWNPLLPDGSSPATDTIVFDPSTFDVLEEIPGNSLILYKMVDFFNLKHNSGSALSFNTVTWIIEGTTYTLGLGNIKTMPNKDYVFYFDCESIGDEGGYIIPLVAHASESVEISNNVGDYITLNPQYAQTPYQPEPEIWGYGDDQEVFEFDKEKSYFLNYATIANGKLTGVNSAAITTTSSPIPQTIHVCQDPASVDEYQVMPIPSYSEDWDTDYSMSGLPINLNQASPTALAINNTSTFNKFLNLPEDRNIYIYEAANPWLSFDITKPHVWNYGCPSLVFSSMSLGWGNTFEFSYIGRLGENRSIDLLSTVAMVAVNDAVPSDEVLENLQLGQLPEEGKIDFEFTDTNVAIGNIPGKNKARVSFDMSRSDWQPPTLQIVRFVDVQGNFTDCYATGEDGVIEFYGGDFNYHFNPDTYVGWYTEESAAEVKVEYAPYGSEAFLPLEVENIPEMDFMPGFGTYYRGSLAGIDQKSENGWFDVRITLTDEAGNYQEQTLSPAFKIDSCVGIETLTYPEINVVITNGKLSVIGCENPIIEVYSADGIKLTHLNGESLDVTKLGQGIYMVNVTDGSKKVVRKVRL